MGRCPLALPLAALLLLILLGWYPGARPDTEPALVGKATCHAEILAIHEAETFGRIAVAEVDSVDGGAVAPFKVRIHFLNEAPALSAGQGLSFCTKFQPLPPKVDVPDARDLQADLRRQGVTVTTELLSDSIKYIEGKLNLNARAYQTLARAPLSDLSIDMLAAMLLGDSQYIPRDAREVFTAAGLSHILALSGMHVGVIAMVTTFALWPLYLTRHKRTRLVLTIMALWGYAAFTGFIPSVTRAVVMATVYLGGRIIQRHSIALNSLCLAAIVILAVRPMELYALGFQLSFGAVAGIIMFFPLINRVNRREHPRLYWLVSFPALSLSAMLFAGVIAAFHFHTFPLLFIVSNILIAPLVPLFLISGLASVTLHITGPTDFLALAIEWVAKTTASVPFAQIEGLYPSAALVMFILLTLCCIAYTRKYWLIVFPIAVMLTAPAAKYPNREQFVISDAYNVYLIDTRDGCCSFHSNLQLESERRDARDFYAIILQDYLRKRGLDSLRLAPKDSLPIEIINGRSRRVLLDSCAPGKIAYE